MIEYALTPESCAVAHHVEEMSPGGDIDHLVATPGGLWVIETKHRRVRPTSEFRKVLRHIARKVEAVREWAPETPVTGCLVFSEQTKTDPTYDHRGETIRAFSDPKELAHALREEVHGMGGSRELARRVWKLGKSEVPDQSMPAG